jgi:hypothetical protein
LVQSPVIILSGALTSPESASKKKNTMADKKLDPRRCCAILLVLDSDVVLLYAAMYMPYIAPTNLYICQLFEDNDSTSLQDLKSSDRLS